MIDPVYKKLPPFYLEALEDLLNLLSADVTTPTSRTEIAELAQRLRDVLTGAKLEVAETYLRRIRTNEQNRLQRHDFDSDTIRP